MMRNVKRNYMHMQTRRSRPITKQNLEKIKTKLDRRKLQHVLFWAIAVVVFHSMARLGEILQTNPTCTSTAIRLQHLSLEKGENGPYTTITLLTFKTHDL